MKFTTNQFIKLACIAFGAQLANAAPLPKEGPMNLLNCWAGDTHPTMIFSKENMLGTLAWTGMLWNPTAGGAFDAMSGECGGHFTAGATGVDAIGQCQFAEGLHHGDGFGLGNQTRRLCHRRRLARKAREAGVRPEAGRSPAGIRSGTRRPCPR